MVSQYIANRAAHHRKQTFEEAFLQMLDRHEIETNLTGRIVVREKDAVAAGGFLTSGAVSPRDMLRIMGRTAAGD